MPLPECPTITQRGPSAAWGPAFNWQTLNLRCCKLHRLRCGPATSHQAKLIPEGSQPVSRYARISEVQALHCLPRLSYFKFFKKNFFSGIYIVLSIYILCPSFPIALPSLAFLPPINIFCSSRHLHHRSFNLCTYNLCGYIQSRTHK